MSRHRRRCLCRGLAVDQEESRFGDPPWRPFVIGILKKYYLEASDWSAHRVWDFGASGLIKHRVSSPAMPHVVANEGPPYRENLTREAVALREFGLQLIWHDSMSIYEGNGMDWEARSTRTGLRHSNICSVEGLMPFAGRV